jgi:hypothetical protein
MEVASAEGRSEFPQINEVIDDVLASTECWDVPRAQLERWHSINDESQKWETYVDDDGVDPIVLGGHMPSLDELLAQKLCEDVVVETISDDDYTIPEASPSKRRKSGKVVKLTPKRK